MKGHPDSAGAIVVRGARVHNLKGVDVDVPRGTLTVFTGPSGSGKSSLAFDTIYAEAQRRYVESLSVYARQFLDAQARPDVDSISGLSPALSVEQRPAPRGPRSTVATMTEAYDYLRLLYARIGRPHCWQCEKEMVRHTPSQIAELVLTRPAGTWPGQRTMSGTRTPPSNAVSFPSRCGVAQPACSP